MTNVNVLIYVNFAFHSMQGIALNCDSKDKLSVVREFVGVPGFDFLKIPSTGEDVRVLVTADQLPQFKVALDAHRVNYDVFVEDVRSIIEADFAQNKRRALLRSRRLREYEGFDGKHFPDYDKVWHTNSPILNFSFYQLIIRIVRKLWYMQIDINF